MKLSYLYVFIIALFSICSACSNGDSDLDDLEEQIENMDDERDLDGEDDEQNDEHGDQDDNDEHDRDCFDFVYPISYTMPDGSTISGDSEDVIDEQISNWYASNGESDIEPKIVFPIQIKIEDRLVDVDSEEALERFITEHCEREEGEDHWDCFEFVYPISFTMPDGSTISGENEEALDELIEDWYVNNGESDQRPQLVYPVQIIIGDQLFDVNSDAALESIITEHCEREEGGDHWDCYEFVYPISYTMPDGSTISGDSEDALDRQIRDWYNENGESDIRPQLIYPIEIIFGDRLIDINSDEEFERFITEHCERDEEQEFDCPELRANFGDPCRKSDETEGRVNEECECV